MNVKSLLLLTTCLSAVFSFQKNNYLHRPAYIQHNIVTDTTLRKVGLDRSNLTISIPGNYKLTKQKGTDYLGFIFVPKNNRDTLSPKGGIYLGNFPNDNVYPDDCLVIKQKILILGKLESLDIKHCNNHYFTQVIIQNPDTTAWYQKIQLFGEARSDEDLHHLILILKSISRRTKEIED